MHLHGDGDRMAHTQAGVPSVKQSLTREPPIQHKMHSNMDGDNIPDPYTHMEPPIQRKKKPIEPRGILSKSAGHLNNNQEYVLLGSTDKFSSNVVYKTKTMIPYEEPKPTPKEVITPMAPRPDPAPRVNINTGAPASSKKIQQERQKSGGKKLEVIQKTAPPPPAVSAKEPRPSKSVRVNSSPVRSPPKVAIVEVPLPKAPVLIQPAAPMQDISIPAEDRAPADYAMKYKAGVAPHRKRGPKRLSEYQMQYHWRNQAVASPILDAEQVVYKSSTQLVPRKANVSKTTEYRRQFLEWQASPTMPKPQAKSATKISRSKSVENLSPDKRIAAGIHKVTMDTDPRLVQQSLNPQRLHFPHGPRKNFSSEYAANFAPPQVFEYADGAWKGANPPQLSPEKARTPAEESTISWYSEVMELRNRAEEYKRRAQGTHFSRQHTAQLLAQQTELWDAASTSSVLSPLSLEQSEAVRMGRKSQKQVEEAPPAGKKTAWGEDRAPVSARSESGRSTSVSATYDMESVQSELSDAPPIPEEDSTSSTPGRVPTPKMSSSGLRHHLDRTTPVQGAILSYPTRDQVVERPSKKRPRSSTTNSVQSSASIQSLGESLHLPEQKSVQTKSTVKQVKEANHIHTIAKPIFGMPTHDAHLLLDESASFDRPLETRFVSNPAKKTKAAQAKPATIQEGGADTYKVSKPTISTQVTLDDIRKVVPEVDALSTSVRSIASSCSLASEVLERARARRNDFWGINGRA